MRIRTVRACRAGQQPEGHRARAGLACRDDETPVCRDEGSTLAVELDGTVAVDSGALQGDRRETTPVLLVKATPVASQQTSGRGLAETQDDVVWQTVEGPVTLEPLTVVAKHPIFGSGPHEADPILKKDFDG